MAATGFTPVSLYYSATASNVPLAANLVAGELAMNTADGKLFFKDSAGVVQTMASKATGAIGGSTTQIQFNNAGALGGSASLTWSGTVLTSSGFSGPLNGTVGATTANTGSFTTTTIGTSETLSYGTANGVAYLNGSKVVTSGSALVFDGTNLGVGVSPASDGAIHVHRSGASFPTIKITNGTTGTGNLDGFDLICGSGGEAYVYNRENQPLLFGVNNSEQMRLTSTGLGIGTSSPSKKLDVNGDALIYGLTIGRGAGAVASNTAVGASALAGSNSGVGQNTAVGYQSLLSNTTGAFNTALGFGAGYSNTTGERNTAIGRAALYNNTTGNYNTATGMSALNVNTTGSSNTATGYNSLTANTTGANNTALGESALNSNTTASNNTAVGYQAGYANTTGSVTAVGYQALQANTTGAENDAFGNVSLKSNTTGNYNVSLGTVSMFSNTTGASNVAIGNRALYSNTTASNNTAVGYQAAYSNTTGGNNVAVGYQALYANTTAGANTAVGHICGTSITTGTENQLFGYGSGQGLTTGNYNTLVGKSAGYFGSSLTTGSNNTYMGYQVNPSSSSVTNEIVIGTNGQTGKGASTGFIAPSTGGVYQGNNSAAWSITSDKRIKKNIVDNNTGLSVISKIQVRNFEYRLPEEIIEVPQDQAIKKQGVQLGVIAQELQQILPECVKTESTGIMTVDTDNLTWYLVNAIKELKAEVDSLKSQLKGA